MIPIRPLAALLAAALALTGLASMATGQEPAKPQAPPQLSEPKKQVPPPPPPPPATPVERIKVPKGFKVELLYTVPRDSQGSWVNLAVDPKGRLITSDQYGKLYRVTPPPSGSPATEIKVEPIPVEIGEAQGLLWAFDSLYVVVNGSSKYKSGLYRATDTDHDDVLDKVELLRKLEGNSEHGPHAVVLAPDGKSLYVVAGNATKLPELSGSLVSKVWGEDNLLPRMVDGRGFMTDEKAPGGYVCRVDPEGKNWELVSMGYRNAYDLAFNRVGDLFTYDSDMEWDMNTPWYRPTRVNLVTPGADYGYRNGAGKWPTYYFDSLPPVVNVGPGSPTGVAFGYGAKFPGKYQEALYLADWSYGKLYAAHLKPQGSAYSADLEEFVTGTPLPLTDVVVNPKDGAMYFAIGGRKTTSGLYRVTYAGPDSTDTVVGPVAGAELREVRRSLEALHGYADPRTVATAWPYLSHPDRFIRTAARLAIEFQDPSTWREKALAETDHLAALESLMALTRVSAADPAHRGPDAPAPDKELEARILGSLGKFGWDPLSYARKLDTLRLVTVLFNRFGPPDEEMTGHIVDLLDQSYPAKGRELNVELCNLLVYLKAPGVAAKTLPLIENAPTQEEQIDLARPLRTLTVGWTPGLRQAYFSWLNRARDFKGGPSLEGFLRQIKQAAVATLTDSEKADLKPILEAPPRPKAVAGSGLPSRSFVKSWTVDDLAPVVEAGLKQKRDYDKGRALFAAANCFSCHRFDNEGAAVGPDLTALAGRFGPRDLLESIILPSKVISDQYEAVIVSTNDGKVVTGRIMNLHNDKMTINTDMLDPSAQVDVNRTNIEEMRPSPISMMPEGLLSTFDKEEVIDLFAYLFSRGDRESKLFR